MFFSHVVGVKEVPGEDADVDANKRMNFASNPEVTADRVSEAKLYSDYIKISEFETMRVFEFGNNSGTRLNQMTQPDQDISRINTESQINPGSRINLDSNQFSYSTKF